MDLSKKQVLVVDNGLFPKMALRLARDFGKVYYYTPQGGQFPDINQCKLGEGLPDVERVDSIFFDGWEDVDLFVFCDVGFGFEQEHLVSLGKRVWGSRKGEDLELMRVQTKKLMKKLGLPVGPYKVLKGMEALREFIKETPGWFIKVDRYRGNFETFCAEDYDLVKAHLDEIQKSTGEWSTILPFVAESPLPDCVEVGTDGFVVDGQFPEKCLSGIEDKDCGYCGIFGNYVDLPEPITRFNTKMAETFKEYQYRGFFSTEVRIGEDHVPYMIDLTCRLPSPPSELYLEMYTNISEIIWEGADGKMVTPTSDFKFGCEIILKSQEAESCWQAVKFPPSSLKFLAFHNAVKINGLWQIPPQPVGVPEIGAAIGLGNTLDEAVEHAKEIADSVRAHGMTPASGTTDTLKKKIEELDKLGLNFYGKV